MRRPQPRSSHRICNKGKAGQLDSRAGWLGNRADWPCNQPHWASHDDGRVVEQQLLYLQGWGSNRRGGLLLNTRRWSNWHSRRSILQQKVK